MLLAWGMLEEDGVEVGGEEGEEGTIEEEEVEEEATIMATGILMGVEVDMNRGVGRLHDKIIVGRNLVIKCGGEI